MKPTSNPKNSSLSVESANPAVTKTPAAVTSSTQESGKSSKSPVSPRSAGEAPNRPPANRSNGIGQAAAVRRTGTSTGRGTEASAKPKTRTSAVQSTEAAKSDRVTMLAFYALFGAMLAGLIYFIALAFSL